MDIISNVKEYLNMETNELQRKDNWDRYSFQGVCDWWSNKASKRYESLIADGRTRTVSETWNTNAESIDCDLDQKNGRKKGE